MLKVTIELTDARTGKVKILGVGRIFNDGSGTPERGDYVVMLSTHGRKMRAKRVENFPRLKRGPWDLLYLALKNIVGKRNEEKK